MRFLYLEKDLRYTHVPAYHRFRTPETFDQKHLRKFTFISQETPSPIELRVLSTSSESDTLYQSFDAGD